MREKVRAVVKAVCWRSVGPAEERSRGLRIFRLVLWAAALAFAFWGGRVIYRQITPLVVIGAFVTLVVLINGRCVWEWELRREMNRHPFRWAGGLLLALLSWVAAGLFGVLALAGFDAVTYEVAPDLDRSIETGLIVGAVVYSASAFLFMRTQTNVRWAALASFTLALLVLGGVPWLVWAVTKGDETDSAGPPLVSKLDVLLISNQDQPMGPATSSKLPSGGVLYSVARLGPDGPFWTLTGSGDPDEANKALATVGSRKRGMTPSLREDADHALVLVVDGKTRTPPREGIRWWLRVARQAVEANIPTFALLRNPTPHRLSRWDRAFQQVGGAAAALEGSSYDTPSEAALSVALGSPDGAEKMKLAVRFRPILLFDDAEDFYEPLNIEVLFDEGLLKLCVHDDLGEHCDEVPDPTRLTSEPSHLEVNREKFESGSVSQFGLSPSSEPVGDQGSTIYVHTVEAEDSHRLYLDYWWYLPLNPFPGGRGVLCGAGLAIAGATCFDHDSDWEGITVVLDTRGDEPRPIAVHYAQHNGVSSYSWDDLTATWAGEDNEKDETNYYENLPEGITRPQQRPLVFVAKGSHASYPTRCDQTLCNQGAATGPREGSYDGKQGWIGNSDAACMRQCVQALPTRLAGTEPASWNAYPGPWGSRDCSLTIYCTSEQAPSGPGVNHARYDDPAHCGQLWTIGADGFKKAPGPCF